MLHHSELSLIMASRMAGLFRISAKTATAGFLSLAMRRLQKSVLAGLCRLPLLPLTVAAQRGKGRRDPAEASTGPARRPQDHAGAGRRGQGLARRRRLRPGLRRTAAQTGDPERAAEHPGPDDPRRCHRRRRDRADQRGRRRPAGQRRQGRGGLRRRRPRQRL